MKFDQPGPRIVTLKELEPHLERLISLETLENQAEAFIGITLIKSFNVFQTAFNIFSYFERKVFNMSNTDMWSTAPSLIFMWSKWANLYQNRLHKWR